MEGASDELLADAGFALDEDADQRALEARQHGEEAAHRRRRPDEAAVTGLADIGRRREGLHIGREHELDAADADAAAEREHRLLDALAQVKRAVSAAEILHRDAGGREAELDVGARNGGILDDQASARPGADDQRLGADPDPRRRAAPGDDLDHRREGRGRRPIHAERRRRVAR